MGGSYKLGYYGAWGFCRDVREGGRYQFSGRRDASEGDGGSVGVPPLRHPAVGTPLQEGVPLQSGVPAPIIIITLQGEPGACSPPAS